MIKFVTHIPCRTPIELRSRTILELRNVNPHHTIVEPWCPRCNRFVDIPSLSSTGPFSAVVRGDEPVLLRSGETHD